MVRRLAARFALLAFGLYHIPLILNDYPSLGGGGFRDDGLSRAWGHVFGQVGLWVARHVFQLSGPMPSALDGDNGDTAAEYGRLLVAVVAAALAAAVWTVVDRRRPRARWVVEALRVLLRYAIVLGLTSYALAKIYPVQFGQLASVSLEAKVGELSPMGLLWHFMEYSPVYSTFAGVMELAVVLLLCFRRTTLLGALLCIPVMANVTLMDLCYGVPVKLFAASMLVSAAALVLLDGRRLIDVIVLQRATAAAPSVPPFRSRRLNRARWLVKLVVVGGVIVSSAVEMARVHDEVIANDALPIAGSWEVGSFVRDGRELAGSVEPARWRRLAVSYLRVAIRREDDTLVVCHPTVDPAARSLSLACRGGAHAGELRWARTGDQLRLDGTFDGAPVSVSLRRLDEAQLPLRRARMQWIMD